MKKSIFYILLNGLLFFTACNPKEDDKIDIGNPPQASFSFEFIDLNNLRFTNTSTDEHFITNWDFGDLGVFSDDVVEVSYPFAGEYDVNLTIFGKGGSTTKTETVTITQDDPSGCVSFFAFLTGCEEKTWKLNPDAGALWVGPDLTGTTWWENTADDVTGRDCDWNDTYVFNTDGEYTYDDKGDLWGEGYMGFAADQCYSTDELSADRAAWKSGNHLFEVIPADGGFPTKLRVIGDGAFIGLRKATNGAEVNFPQLETTYDVVETRTEGNRDIILLEVFFGGGYWRFTIASEG